MVEIKSLRARKLLENPRFLKNEKSAEMKRFPLEEIKVWGSLSFEGKNVKNLSIFTELPDHQKLVLEVLGTLLLNKPLNSLDQISTRECEAFLRDKNSEPALVGMSDQDEMTLKKIIKWLRSWSDKAIGQNYHFHSENGPFRKLKIVDKIRELKAFFSSNEILTLYSDLPAPEVVDVEDLTVYIQIPYESDREKSLLHELHNLGVIAFGEENLNFIPEP